MVSSSTSNIAPEMVEALPRGHFTAQLVRAYLLTRSVRDREALVLDCDPIVKHLLKIHRVYPEMLRDAYQEGMIGILLALQDFREGGVVFGVWAFWKAQAAIVDFLRREIGATRCLPPGQVRRKVESKREDVEGLEVEDGRPDPDDRILFRQVVERMDQMGLTVRERMLIVDHIMEDEPMEQLGIREGVTKQAISLTKQKLLKKLRGIV